MYCGPNSQLVKQCHAANAHALRFGLAQCDLGTGEGRRYLFQKMCEHRPKHIWFAPECKLWGSWSALNGQKSLQAFDKQQQSRILMLAQVALGITLLRVQTWFGAHLHWEQPRSSLMLRLACLREVRDQTVETQVDLCQLGMIDPESGMAMRKSLTVLTTSNVLGQVLDSFRCRGEHDHQVIAGSTHVDGRSVLRSKISENYPRKFARAVVQTLKSFRGMTSQPIGPQVLHAETYVIRQAESPVDHRSKRPKVMLQGSSQFRRRADVTPTAVHEPDDRKRRRLHGKQSATAEGEAEARSLMQVVHSKTPRVGKVVLRDHDLLERFQALLPDKKVICVVACRGTDRTLGPPSDVHPDEIPLRKAVFVRRADGTLFLEDSWEAWTALPKSQVIRPNHACRLNATVFAQPWPAPEASQPVGMSGTPPGMSLDTEPFEAGELGLEEPRNAGSDPRRVLSESNDVAQHSSFRSLSAAERSWLAKAHKNLGHPSGERLAALLTQQQYPARLVEASRHFQCSTCQESQQPKLARPATIRSALDFNDKVSMDKLVFTNQQGSTYNVYHLVDHATSFHHAFVAPQPSSESVIAGLTRGWLSWAGAPGELVCDAGSEFCSDAFKEFLQSHNIRCTVITPRAHWQNGRAERHGAILEAMLKKFDVEQPIVSYLDLEQALWHVIQSKNALSLRRGYSPETLVLGKATRLPGSVTSDDLCASHLLAQDDTGEGIRFRDQLARRELARRAFHAADNSDALRRALLRRSRPGRNAYATGEWIMMQLPKGQGQTGSQWTGPMQVVSPGTQHEVWATLGNRLFRAAPEHCRPLSSHEAGEFRPLMASSLEGPSSLPEHPSSRGPADQVSAPHGIMSRPGSIEIPEGPTASEPIRQTSPEQPDREPSLGSNQVTPTPSVHADLEPIDASCVPLPDGDDESGLWTEAGSPLPQEHEHVAWRTEIYLQERDIEAWKTEDDPSDLAFVASAGKRQNAEVRLSDLSDKEREMFEVAKVSEIQNWIKYKAIEKITRSQLSPEQILKSRWILTWKPLDPSEITDPAIRHKAKARLVILGYLDPNLTDIPRDSPTLGRHSRMLILQMLASRHWQLMSFDIKAAFMQGRPQESRQMGLEPVPEMRKELKLGDDDILKLVKSAYGLVDAPYLWYQALASELRALGFQEAPWDPCVWVLRDKDSRAPKGILGVHVDDGLCGGDADFQAKIDALERKFAFGSKRVRSFTFTGIELAQKSDGSIVMSQSAYVRAIKAISLSPTRRAQLDELVTSEERHRLRGLIGSLQYAAVNTRPDLASRLSQLQSKVPRATVETLLEANRVLHEAKAHHDVELVLQPIRCEDLRFLAFCDASFASAKCPDSHAGSIILATHRDISLNKTCTISPLTWASRKIQKVVTSTLSAETMAMNSTLDQLSWIKLYWSWLLDDRVQWRDPQKAFKDLPEAVASVSLKEEPSGDVAATDCRSLYDLLTRTAMPSCSEFRTQLHARAIRDLLNEGIRVRWVHTGAQLADCLTKVMSNQFMRETLKHGQYQLADEAELLKARATNRDRLRWLHTSKPSSQKTQDIFRECEISSGSCQTPVAPLSSAQGALGAGGRVA